LGGVRSGIRTKEFGLSDPEEVLYSRGAQVRYRRILDLQKAAIHVVDRDLRLVFFNAYTREWAESLGYPLGEESLGEKLFDLFPFLDKKVLAEYKAVFAEGKDLATEESFNFGKGDLIALTQKIPVFQDSRVAEVITTITDVTDIRRTEAKLESSQERFRMLFEFAPVAYYLSDLKGVFLDGNRASEELIGYSKKELVGKNYLSANLLPKDQLPTAAKILANAVLGKVTGPYELRLRRSDGRRVDIELSQIHIKLDRKTRILGVAVDVTQRKQAQEKEQGLIRNLRRLSEIGMKFVEISKDDDIFQNIGEMLHSLVGNCYVGVSDYHEKDGVIEVKSLVGAQEIFKDVLKIMGRDPVGMRVTPDPQAVKERLSEQRLMRIPGGLHEVIFGKLPQPVCTALETLGHVNGFYSVGFIRAGVIYGTAVILLRDRETFRNQELVESFISQASVALQRWKAENRIAASLKEKEVLLREIHHRVKNNMQIISSLLRLQSVGVSDPDALELFQASQDRIRSMALVHEGLYRSSDLSHIDFTEYVRKLTSRLLTINPEAASRVRIDVDIEEIKLDINRAVPCGLIINELVTNSLKHGFPENRTGEIFIRMAQDKRGKITLSVADSGVGIPPEVNFKETDSLGMQIVADLVQQLNGTIRMSTKGGTQFTIRF
jgi:PAS domain S-box-containing protein